MDIGYEVIKRSLKHGTKNIRDAKGMGKWAKKNRVSQDDLEKISEEIATIAITDMRDNERGLLEALGGTFMSGFIAAFEMLRPGVADETFQFIAEGKRVEVKVTNVERHD